MISASVPGASFVLTFTSTSAADANPLLLIIGLLAGDPMELIFPIPPLPTATVLCPVLEFPPFCLSGRDFWFALFYVGPLP